MAWIIGTSITIILLILYFILLLGAIRASASADILNAKMMAERRGVNSCDSCLHTFPECSQYVQYLVKKKESRHIGRDDSNDCPYYTPAGDDFNPSMN